MKFGILAAALGGLLLAAAAAKAQSDAGTQTDGAAGQTAEDAAASDPVVAVVNGQELRRSDVIQSASTLPPAYQQNIEQLFPALVDRLIDLTLLTTEGRERGLQDDEMVREMVADFEDEAIRQVLLQRHLEENLTEERMRERYEQIVDDFEPRQEIRARHILLESKEEAEAVIVELDGGADFVALARERSTGPSAPEGGDLGYFTADQMVPAFAEAAFGLEAGAYTKEPVQTQFGWHVIKVEDRRETEPPSFEEAQAQIENELSQELVREFLANLRENAEIEKLGPAGPAAGGPAQDGAGQPPADAAD